MRKKRTVLMESNHRPTHPRFDLLRLYHGPLREWFDNLTSQEMEFFKKHNYGDRLLLKVEINWWLIESLADKWDPTSLVFSLVNRFVHDNLKNMLSSWEFTMI